MGDRTLAALLLTLALEMGQAWLPGPVFLIKIWSLFSFIQQVSCVKDGRIVGVTTGQRDE